VGAKVYSIAAEETANTLAAQGWSPIGFGFNSDQHYFVWVLRPC
jgi:hypothetical protein